MLYILMSFKPQYAKVENLQGTAVKCLGLLWLQAPYLVYVEVLECDNATTAPLPSKLLNTATIHCAHSEDDLACCYSSTRSPMTAELSVCSDMPLVEYDESEEWTLEDDDIIQASLSLQL